MTYNYFPGGSVVRNPPAMQETWVQSLGWEDPLEKEMATHSSTLAWEIPWREEPGGLQSMGSHRVGHDWGTACTHTHLVLECIRVSASHLPCSSLTVTLHWKVGKSSPWIQSDTQTLLVTFYLFLQSKHEKVRETFIGLIYYLFRFLPFDFISFQF